MRNKNFVHILFTVVMSIVMIAVIGLVLAFNTKDNSADAPSITSQIAETGSSPVDEDGQLTTARDDTDKQSTASPANSSDELVSYTLTEPVSRSPESVIKGGYWYLYDEDNVVCYVFSFDGKGNVDLAMFDDSNISGEDAKYFTGYSTYTVKDDTVQLRDMPDVFLEKSFDLVVEGANLKYDGKFLAHHQEQTIDYAIGFKMASELKKMGK
ncbi:MAG: hypothetical protein PUE73_06155 [Eubacteriales bacterium]|nr:hypothetical protein [Eubacteriales bacterium]